MLLLSFLCRCYWRLVRNNFRCRWLSQWISRNEEEIFETGIEGLDLRVDSLDSVNGEHFKRTLDTTIEALLRSIRDQLKSNAKQAIARKGRKVLRLVANSGQTELYKTNTLNKALSCKCLQTVIKSDIIAPGGQQISIELMWSEMTWRLMSNKLANCFRIKL